MKLSIIWPTIILSLIIESKAGALIKEIDIEDNSDSFIDIEMEGDEEELSTFSYFIYYISMLGRVQSTLINALTTIHVPL